MTRNITRLFSLMIALAALSGCESPEEQTTLYNAWCKVHECNGLSQAEWQALRSEVLLPGQTRDTSTDALAAGLIAGSVAGSVSSSRK